jgi:signal peptidase I
MGILTGATRWLRRIVDLALIGLIVAVLLAVALGKVVPVTGRESIVIGGRSMEPAIPLGSTVVITPVTPADLVIGDVVSLQIDPSKATFTHRIVDVVDRPDGRWIRTKGDANADPDPTLVPASAVLGRVDLTVPLVGYLIVLLSAPIGVLFVLGLGATLLAIAWLLESLELEGLPLAAREAVARRSDQGEPIAMRTVDPAAPLP